MFFTVNLAQDKSRVSRYLSNTLLSEIENTLARGEKTLLYLNKRGAFSSLICEDCQYLFECPNCDVSLSVHSHPRTLLCHLCGNAEGFPVTCKNCRGNKLLSVGVGTQQIEEVLGRYFENESKKESSVNSGSQPSHLNSLSQREKEVTIYSQKKYNPEYITNLSKELRKFGTDAETALWEVLKNRKFHNLKFRRQHPIGRYITDFYCHELKFVIELDGEIHEKTKQYDEVRDEYIQSQNIQVLRFGNIAVFQNLDTILNSIIPFIPLPLGEVRGGGESGQDVVKPTIYRFDSDSMKTVSSKKEALSDLNNADIIIGTKMLTTGFDFEKVGLIGVILVEQELAYPSFDAEERAYANLKQLIGRGNRKSQKTDIILQTFIPKHQSILSLTESHMKDFFVHTLKERKDFSYPPYQELVRLEYRDISAEKTLKFIEKLVTKLETFNENQEYTLLSASTTFRKNNSHHAHIIVKGKNIRKLLKNIGPLILRTSKLSVVFS